MGQVVKTLGRKMIKMEIDFVCVGFPKCGTTSLYSVLRQHPQIKLAKGKETSFFDWCGQFAYPLRTLQDQFFGSKRKSGERYGLIESEFFMNAADIKFYFGSNVKLIFMLRNPVDRLYSAFKMRLRQGYGNIMHLYRRHRDLSADRLFEVYCREFVVGGNKDYSEEFETGNYIKWLQQFMDIFSIENIKIILLEEYHNNAELEIKGVEQFLDVNEKKMRTNKIENEGNAVSKNYYGARLNGFFNGIYKTHNGYFVKHPKLGEQWINLRNKIYVSTLIQEESCIGGDIRHLCEGYYRKSKDELACYLNKNLDSIWFH